MLTPFPRLVNAIKPGSVPKINASAMPFKQMVRCCSGARCLCVRSMRAPVTSPFQENISNFLKACRALGMLEFEMFSTADLFEEKDITQVRKRTVQLACCLPRCVTLSLPAAPPFHTLCRLLS